MGRFILCLILCLVVSSDRIGGRVRVTAAPANILINADDKIPTADEFNAWAKDNKPIDCLKAAVNRYRKDTKLLHAKLIKEERLGRRPSPPETIDVWYRTEPHSVMMKWESRPVGRAQQLIFVEGANDNKMLVKPKGILAVAGIVEIDPDSADAKAGSRQNIKKSGPLKASEEALAKWTAAKEKGELKVKYLGLKEIEQAGKRKCHVFRRTIEKPEEDGIAIAEIALDAETWIQLASVLKDAKDQLLGSYYFKVVEVNPKLPDGLFEKSSLMRQ